MLSADPVFPEFHGRGVAGRGMDSPSVVEQFDVVEQVGLRCGPRTVAGAMHPLILPTVEEAFRRSVVPAVALPAHRADHPILFQPRLKGVAGILTSPVGVMHQARRRLPAEPRHGQRIHDDVRRHPELERPADDFPVQIENDGQVEPALVGSDVGHVGNPYLIRLRRREIPGQQVRRYRQRVLGVGRGLEAPLVACPDAVLPHQPLHTLLARRESPVTQFAHHAWATVGSLQLVVDGLDQRQHLRVRQPLAIRTASAFPCLIPTDADFQHGTGFRQSIRPSMLVNPGILHSTFLAKYAVAFFRISFSRFTESSLNSAVYSCFGIFFNFASPSNLPGRYTPSIGRRNFGRSSNQ